MISMIVIDAILWMICLALGAIVGAIAAMIVNYWHSHHNVLK